MPLKSNLYAFTTIILAAGISKRMHSRTPKVLYKILGKPMIQFPVDLARSLNCSEIVVVCGKNYREVKKILGKDVKFAIQEIARGTGDAAKKGLTIATNPNILILYGDVPLLKKETINGMIENHFQNNADLTVLTCELPNPTGYGRIVRNNSGKLVKIVEHIDATEQEKRIKEINTGIYFGSKALISNALTKINTDNKQKEFYLTDIVHNLIKAKKKVIGFKIEDPEQIMGINTKLELAQIRDIVKKRWLSELMLNGVYIEDPNTTNIDLSVKIGKFVQIKPFTLIEGNTHLRDNMVIPPFTWIKNNKKKKYKG
ncbi:MAG: NTP transferase domain-containing protein [bacterium]